MLLYAAAALQVHVNYSTPMFQHPAKPSKSFLHTKIYSSNKSIVFLLLISRGSHILTVWQQSVSSSGSPTLLLVSAVHFTVMSQLWSLMMSASHVTGPLTEPQSAQSPCSHSPALISPRAPRVSPDPVTGRCGANPRCWTGAAHSPSASPDIATLTRASVSTQGPDLGLAAWPRPNLRRCTALHISGLTLSQGKTENCSMDEDQTFALTVSKRKQQDLLNSFPI